MRYKIDKDGTIIRDEDAIQEDRIEREKVAEIDFWNKCQTKEDYKKYLGRYPKGRYVSNAKSIIAQKEKEEEDGYKRDKLGCAIGVMLEIIGIVIVSMMSNEWWNIGDWIGGIFIASLASFVLYGLVAILLGKK